jgi:hypothetical protein
MSTTAQPDLVGARSVDGPAETHTGSDELLALEHRFCIPTVEPLPPRPVVDSPDW